METVALFDKIEEYVTGRMTATEKADFEAEMMMDKILEQEVARQLLKKAQIEKKIQQHIERAEKERLTSLQTYKIQKISFTQNLRNKWGNLLEKLSSN